MADKFNCFCHSCNEWIRIWMEREKKVLTCPNCGKRTLKVKGVLTGYAMHVPEWMTAAHDMKPSTGRYDAWRKTEGEQLLREGKVRVPTKGEVERDCCEPDVMYSHRKQKALEKKMEDSVMESTRFASKVWDESKGSQEAMAKAAEEYAAKK